MKASIDWLNDYIDLSGLSPREVADKLTMAGLEVENLSDRFAHLNQVVSARLDKVEPMPKSDHLNICQVDAGSFGRFQVVCGAPNAREGLVAPLALVGVTLPNGMTIQDAKLRGHESHGMLCSEVELGLGQGRGGIIELSAEPGRTLKEIYGREDWVMEIGITPNRPDGLSIIGLARDLAALLKRPLKSLEARLEETGPDVNTLASVEIEAPEHAGRYVARVVTGLKIGPSPAWLANRLAAVGIRSISNVVDVTNYVMIEMGLPLHAFDLDTVAERRIVVKTQAKGTHFTTLDGQDRELKAEVNLMICDGEKAVGLAGIMGGLNSEIKDSTTDILLEGAYFNATTIRKTSRALGLSTDASYRFERGCDPEICPRAVDRAIGLMAELAGGQVAAGRIDRYPRPFQALVVPFSPEKCNAYLGTKHQTEDMLEVLSTIGLKLEPAETPGLYRAALPSWRPDLSREVDVWEEVARLLDFDRLPATLPAPPVKRQSPPPAWTLRETVRNHLAAQGFSESISYSFINQNFADKLGLADESPVRRRILPLLNPLSEEQGVLRPLMAPGLLGALRLNQNQGQKEAALFELGAVFLSNGQDKQPDERQTIGGLWGGLTGSGNWIEPERPVDFWDIKGVAESLAERLNLALSFERGENLPPWYNPAEAALIKLADGRLLGHLGRLNKKAAKAFGLKETFGPVYLFELDAQEILNASQRKPFQGWSKFPPADRDMALVLDKDIPASRVIAVIREDAALPLADLLLFDLYEGDQVPEGKKSLAFRLTFQTSEKTLTDEEVNAFFKNVTSRLEEKLGAALRS